MHRAGPEPHDRSNRRLKAIVVVALVVSATTTLVTIRAVDRVRLAERREAESKAESAFLSDLLFGRGFETANGLGAPFEGVLRDAASAIDLRRPPLPPEAEARVREAIGQAYLTIREARLAEPQLSKALKFRRENSAGPSAELAESLNDLGLTFHLLGLREPESLNRMFDEADRLYGEALSMRRQFCGEQSGEVASTINNIAGLRQTQSRLAEAEDLFRQSLTIRRAVLGPDHRDVAQSLHNLAYVLKQQGIAGGDQKKLDEAESLYREALAARRVRLGPSHPFLADTLNNLATLLRDRGRPADAEPYQREAVAIRKTSLPLGAFDMLIAQSSLGLILLDQGKGDEAELALREALDGLNKLEPQRPALAATTRSALGAALVCKGQFEAAEPLILEAYQAVRDDPHAAWNSKKVVIERAVHLYEQWGKDDRAGQWRAKLQPAPGTN